MRSYIFGRLATSRPPPICLGIALGQHLRRGIELPAGVTGPVLSSERGLLWPDFMAAGAIIGMPLSGRIRLLHRAASRTEEVEKAHLAISRCEAIPGNAEDRRIEMV